MTGTASHGPISSSAQLPWHGATKHALMQCQPTFAVRRGRQQHALPSLGKAEVACNADSQCTGVYDSACDSNGDGGSAAGSQQLPVADHFYLCRSTAKASRLKTDCVYTKWTPQAVISTTQAMNATAPPQVSGTRENVQGVDKLVLYGNKILSTFRTKGNKIIQGHANDSRWNVSNASG